MIIQFNWGKSLCAEAFSDFIFWLGYAYVVFGSCCQFTEWFSSQTEIE